MVRQQAERMRRQIDYHLAQARLASGPSVGVHCPVRDVADALVRTLHRLYAERDLRIDIDTPAGQAVTARREDLEEMLGNLLDNACKWAKSHVVISSAEAGADILIRVDDDGEGLPAEMRNVVIRRGVRADEKSAGSGLGLAIVHDLAELYSGALFLEASPLGGVRANLRIPGSRPERT